MSAHLRKLIIASVTLLVVGVGCAAESEEDTGDEADGALSASVCTPRAQTAKTKAYDACSGGTFDFSGCTKPAYTKYDQYLARVDAAWDAAVARAGNADAQWKQVDADCVNLVTHKDCATLLEGDAFEAAKFKNGRGDQGRCNTARASAIADCHAQARSAASSDDATNPYNDQAYVAVLNESGAQNRAWLGTIVSCAAEKAGDTLHDSVYCGSVANSAYNSTYSACRRTCPNESHGVCTPKSYADQGRKVECGSLEVQKGWFGTTCESSYICQRTAVCDKYDTQRAAVVDSKLKCPTGQVPRFTIETHAQGSVRVASDVTFACVTP